MIELLKMDNMDFSSKRQVDLIYCDMIYENENLDWIGHFWGMLREGGVFIVQTDWHTIFDVGYYLKYIMWDSHMINHIVWKNEFGNFPKNKFRQSHDDIIVFGKEPDLKNLKYKFYPERVQMQKATAKSKGLNPSGRTTKLATTVWNDVHPDVWEDICLTTVSKERVKKENNVSIRWQKPLKLMDRICKAFTDEGDFILDPFAGSGTLGHWCKENNRDYVGIEYDEEVFNIAKRRLENA